MKSLIWQLCKRASMSETIFATAAVSSSMARKLDGSSFAMKTPKAADELINAHQISLQPTIQFARHFFSTPWPNIGAQKTVSGDGDDDDGWEEEEDDTTEAQIGDGAEGGGIVLQGVPWGHRTLSMAQEVLSQHTDDAGIVLFAFRTSPRGFIYIRLDKLSERYGCPSMEELEAFSRLYKTQLEKVGESGEIPKDLAVEVSSPGAERLLKVPEDLDRFKEMPMRVVYMDEHSLQKDGVFFLDSIDNESEKSVWRLANVKENYQRKGKAFNRKQKDWRLPLSFQALKRVTLYLEF